jgi:hypothetical protein
MKESDRDTLPPELMDMGERLRSERPQATPFELDRIHARARAQVTRRPRPASGLKGVLVKSRLAITMMLVCGLLVSGTGGALALSGGSSSGSASQAEYCPTGSTDPSCSDIHDKIQTHDKFDPKQQTTDNGNLPFTGYAAVPVVLVGLGLLGFGVFLRRENRRRSVL